MENTPLTDSLRFVTQRPHLGGETIPGGLSDIASSSDRPSHHHLTVAYGTGAVTRVARQDRSCPICRYTHSPRLVTDHTNRTNEQNSFYGNRMQDWFNLKARSSLVRLM
eukprot:1186018-Prorocentrum_minimum.AAC.1